MTVALLLGLLFGATATLLNVASGDVVLDGGPRRVASLVVNSGAAWAGAAVLGGWLLGSVRRGLVAGPVVLVAAVVSYYVLGALVGSENADGSPDQIALFGAIGLAAGAVLGPVGGLIGRPGPLGLAAALVVPLGVATEQVWRAAGPEPPDPARPTADLVLVTLGVAGAAFALARYARTRRLSWR